MSRAPLPARLSFTGFGGPRAAVWLWLVIAGLLCSWRALPQDLTSIDAAEYFWDADPGEGSGTAVQVTATDFYLATAGALPFAPPVTNLAPGLHKLGFRVRSAAGQWSDALCVIIEVQDAEAILSAVTAWPASEAGQSIAGSEYFWDTDPGFGSGTNLAIAPAAFLQLSATSSPPFLAGLSSLTPGTHRLNFRVRNAGGEWSETLAAAIEILDSGPILEAVTQWPSSEDPRLIVGGEYFWESDPGMSNATAFSYPGRNVLVPGAGGVPYLSFDVGQLEPGLHWFGYRVRDAGGRWSQTLVSAFSIEWSNHWSLASADQLPTGSGVSMGAAWGDYTRDGYPDLFVGNQSTAYNWLLRNNGDGSLTQVSATQAVASVLGAAGGAWADFDNDGYLDLFVPGGWGEPSHLYHNNRSGSLLLVTNSGIPSALGRVRAAAWGDYDGDGWLDLFVPSLEGADRLFRNLGDGTFADVTGAGVANLGRQCTAAAWCDFDQDGHLDLAVGCGDVVVENTLLFHNNGDGTFTSVANAPFTEDSGLARSVQWVDYDNDGDFDLFVLNAGGGTSRLYRNNGDGSFSRMDDTVLAPAGFNQQGCVWGDFDRDGWQDLIIVNGTQRLLYWHNNGDGTFSTRQDALTAASPPDSIAVAAADYDRDGDLDLMFTDEGTGVNQLYLNAGNGANWLAVRCVSSNGSPAAIGAVVRLEATIGGRTFRQTRQISGQGGLPSQDNPEAFFGLGDASRIEQLQVVWPRGVSNTWTNVPLNQLFTAMDSTAPVPACVSGGGSIQTVTNWLPLNYTFTPVPKPYYGFAGWSDGFTNPIRTVNFGAAQCVTALFTNLESLEDWGGYEVPVGTPKILVQGELALSGIHASTNPGPVTVQFLTSFNNGCIFYTLDGSDPDPISSPWYDGTPLEVTSPAEIRAIAYTEDLMAFSAVMTNYLVLVPIVSLQAGTLGGGTVSPASASCPSNAVVTLVASNAPGWTFLHWTGDAEGTNPTVAITMDRSRQAQAVFGTTLTLTAPSGGSLQRDPAGGLSPFGSTVLLSAIPQPSKYFARWIGAAVGRSNSPLAFLVTNANPSVGALFGNLAATQVSLTLLAGGQGSITSAPAGNVFPSNTVVTITATPGSNYSFLAWSGGALGNANPLTVALVSNTVITANFVPGPATNQAPTVTLSSPTDGATFTAPAAIGLIADASDPESSLRQVQFLSGSTILGVKTNPPYSLTWSSVGSGSYTLRAVAVDGVGLTATSPPVTVTVAAPNPTQPVFTLSSASNLVSEGAGAVVITVLKSAGSLAGTVNYGTAAGSAKAALDGFGDFRTVSGSISFAATETSKTVQVEILNDSVYKGNRDFTFSLSTVGAASALGTPNATTITIQEDDPPYSTNSLLDVYFPSAVPAHDGALAVFLEPPQGQWRFPWETAWHSSGAVVSGLPAGNYDVEFKPVTSYLQPDALTVAVSAGSLARATNYYAPASTPELGSLKVTLEPEEVSGNAQADLRGQWRLQGEAGWRDGGATVSNLLAGEYVLEFKTVAGRETPASRVVLVAGGQSTQVGVTYLLASTSSATPPSVLQFLDIIESPLDQYKLPYAFCGQLQTDVGYGSGAVVREKVVLSAAHVVFNDADLTFVDHARWFFQRQTGDYELLPIEARGWYVFSGYASARTNDHSPGVSSPLSQNQDVAALFFLTPAGRGGSSGFLASDAAGTEWLQVSDLKTLVGYPVEGIVANNVGRMHATIPSNVQFSRLLDPVVNRVFTTASIRGYPGMSGGPVCVRYTNGRYYPAGVFLGGTSQTVVRAIDGGVVDLINRADFTANTGNNNTGGGVISINTGGKAANSKPYLRIELGPSEAVAAGAGFSLDGAVTFITSGPQWPNYQTFFTAGTTSIQIQFKTVPGWEEPPTTVVQLVGGQVQIVTATYVRQTPAQLSLTPAEGLSSSGFVGGPFAPASAVYAVSNAGSAALSWSAGKSAAWLSLAPSAGTLAGGGVTNVTVNLNANAAALAEGSYADTVTFINLTSGLGNTSRAISLAVRVHPPVRFTNPRVQNDGALICTLEGVTGRVYSILTSTNLARPLADWSEARRVTNAGGLTTFTLTNSTPRYYRAKELP